MATIHSPEHGVSADSKGEGNLLRLKDITIRFLSEDAPDSTERNVRLTFSNIGENPSVVEGVELQEVGHLTWASDRFIDLPLSGAEGLSGLALWPGGQPIASFRWSKASLLELIGGQRDTSVEQPAMMEGSIPNAYKPILSFAIYAGKGAPNQDPLAETFSGLLDPIETADAKSLRHFPFSLPPLPLLLRAAGELFLRRWKTTQSLPLLDNSIASFERVVRLTHPVDNREEYTAYLHKAVDVFILRRASNPNDHGDLPATEWRIARMKRFAKSFDRDDVLPPLHFFFLGHLLFWKFSITESVDDISNSVSTFERQVSLMAPGDADYPNAVKSLCSSLDMRHARGTGNVEDINTAITYLHVLLQHTSPNNPAVKADILAQLASRHHTRSISTMDTNDITRAINYQRDALALRAPGHPKDVQQLARLVHQLNWRSGLLDDVGDCNEAISICEAIVQSNPRESCPPMLLEALAYSLTHRASLTNSLPDLSHAISVLQTTIDATPPASPSRNSLLLALSHASSTRWSMTFSIGDLQASITVLEKAIEGGAYTRADGLHVLGTHHRIFFAKKGDLERISTAIDKLEASVDLTPKGDYRLPIRLHDLALAFAERYEVTGATDDIDNAIAAHEQVIALTPTDSIHLAPRLAWFASTLEGRYKQEKSEDNLNAAISMFQRALDNLPHVSTQLALEPFVKGRFAHLLGNRFNTAGNPEDLKTAVSLVDPMVNDPTMHLGYRLTFASACTLWSLWAEDAGEESALRYGAIAIDLLAQSTSLEQTLRDRYSHLVSHYIHGVVCAGVAFHFGRLETGLEWLEQGRCLVWTQIYQLQTPLDDLRIQLPDLAEKLEQAGKFIRSMGSREPSAGALPSADALTLDAHKVQQHTDAAQEWRQTLEEIRSIEGFRGFLKPPKAADLLARLPQEGVIVTFSILAFGCLAVALIAGCNIVRVPLGDFSTAKASELRGKLKAYLKEAGVLTRSPESLRGMSWENGDSGSRVLSSVLADLWLCVVKPIVYGLKLEPVSSNRPRIWWCPTGPLSFLPLHAAGLYGSDYTFGSHVSDYAISSYSPNVTILLNKLEQHSKQTASANCLLLVSQPDTPGLSPIPATTEETQAVKNIMQGVNVPCVLIEREDATLAEVTAAMKSHSWVHLACHGSQIPGDPLKSGFHLHDGRLELLDMIQQDIPNTDHAFLSACQTSAGDEKLSEEVVHVAASMLAAGYRSVVATMWSIRDSYGPAVAKMFYQHIAANAGNGSSPVLVDSNQSALALDRAVRQLREEVGDEEDGLLTWVPYVHFGI